MSFLNPDNKPLLIVTALLVDHLVGDPATWPHPVQLFGWLITKLEMAWNKGSATARRLKGICLVVILIPATAGLSQALVQWLGRTYLGLILLVWLISTTLAVNSLQRHALQVYTPLVAGDLDTARHFTRYIVGRDVDRLDEAGIVRAVIETVAENTADGITVPLFYLLICGLPGAMTYKMINTLDSMLGYRNERLLYFGWAAAKLDDVANYLPARITGLLVVVIAWVLKYDARSAWRYLKRDASKHPSPNSGWLEASFAGALGLQLGGLNYYHGLAEQRPRLGEQQEPFQAAHILAALELMQGVSYAFAALGILCLVVIS